MADSKISDLPAKAPIAATDIIPVVDKSVSPFVTKETPISTLDARFLIQAVAMAVAL